MKMSPRLLASFQRKIWVAKVGYEFALKKPKEKPSQSGTPTKSKGRKGKAQSKRGGGSPFKDKVALGKKLHSATW